MQGSDLVTSIEQQFEVPYDPLVDRPGVFSDNLIYWRGFAWNAGTTITVCGVNDADIQNAILELVEREVKGRGLCDVEVVFRDETKIEKDGNRTRTWRGPIIRKEIIRGVTKDWREQLIQN